LIKWDKVMLLIKNEIKEGKKEVIEVKKTTAKKSSV
jgi:hypothetical protein